MDVRTKYQLAYQFIRAQRGAEAFHSMTSYDRYCEITSFSDLREDNYGEIADYVDEQADRAEWVAGKQRAFVDQHIGKLDVELIKVASQHFNSNHHYNRTPELGCYLNREAHWISVMDRMPWPMAGKDEIRYVIDWAKREGWENVRYHERRGAHYRLMSVSQEKKARLREELRQFYSQFR